MNKVQGYFTGCDMVPGFYEELRAIGTDLDMSIFKPAGQGETQEQTVWRRRAGDIA